MWTSIRRPSPSMSVALVALFVALGGTGYAAVKINGKNIKKGTISGKKLKNRTLGTAKLTTAARSSLRGQPGATVRPARPVRRATRVIRAPSTRRSSCPPPG